MSLTLSKALGCDSACVCLCVCTAHMSWNETFLLITLPSLSSSAHCHPHQHRIPQQWRSVPHWVLCCQIRAQTLPVGSARIHKSSSLHLICSFSSSLLLLTPCHCPAVPGIACILRCVLTRKEGSPLMPVATRKHSGEPGSWGCLVSSVCFRARGNHL